MKKPLVSIIMANYNKGPFLAATLDSVLRQTYKRIELVVCDDGSTDQSPGILKEYAMKDRRIIVSYLEHNGCIPRLRNTAVKKSAGEYILNLDSDDILYADAVETLVTGAEKYKLDVCFGSMVFIDEYGSPCEPRQSKGSPYEYGRLIKHMYLAPPRLYRKKVYMATSGYNEELLVAEDWDFYLRLEEQTLRFGWAGPRPLFCYRRYRRSQSSVFDTDRFRQLKDQVAGTALARRHAHRILIIGRTWDQEYVDQYRKKGHDVVTFFKTGVVKKDLEQYTWEKHHALRYRIIGPLYCIRSFLKNTCKKKYDYIIIKDTLPWLLRMVLKNKFKATPQKRAVAGTEK